MRRVTRFRRLVAVVGSLALAAGLAGCGSGSGGSEGEPLTLWARDDSKDLLEALVERWNADHTPKVKLTAIPSEQYVTKLAAAAGGNQLPDLAASDIVYLPQLIESGLLADISERIDALPYGDALVPAFMNTSSRSGKTYAVPSYLDLSALFYNKDLFREAGLDPEEPPKTWGEIEAAAQKITALGDDTYGFYTSGNCAGCLAFTFLPLVWADGGRVLNEDGTAAQFTDPNVAEALELYHRMWQDGSIPPASQTDTGTDFGNAFGRGNIGMAPMGGGQLASYLREDPGFEWGVTALPGSTGGTSTFVGGDVVGITSRSDRADEAWKFLRWTLDEKQQTGIYAEQGEFTVRTDLTDAPAFATDPQRSQLNALIEVGRTPTAVPYNEIFNDPTGPFLAMVRRGVYEGETEPAVKEAQQQVSSILTSG